MTYQYLCQTCGEFEVQQRISDQRLRACPKCGAADPKRLISRESGGFRLVSGDSGGWGSSGYAKPVHERVAEQRLGRKLHRPVT